MKIYKVFMLRWTCYDSWSGPEIDGYSFHKTKEGAEQYADKHSIGHKDTFYRAENMGEVEVSEEIWKSFHSDGTYRHDPSIRTIYTV